MTKEKQNDAMPSKGVRLRVDQWEDCDRFSETLKMASRNDFIRDAIDFYLEYLRRNNSVKFLTPALESVISAKVRDSEERLYRQKAVDNKLITLRLTAGYSLEPVVSLQWANKTYERTKNNGKTKTAR